MHFTYRGFFENPQNVPARIMKQKLLHRNDSEPTAKGFAYDEDVKSTMIADFSAVDVFYQEAARIAFWEGEPDSFTWRHYHPKDAILCLGNVPSQCRPRGDKAPYRTLFSVSCADPNTPPFVRILNQITCRTVFKSGRRRQSEHYKKSVCQLSQGPFEGEA